MLTELDAVGLCRARNRLLRTVREMLVGSGLDIRARKKELVVSNPRNRDQGRIYINYTSGEVSWQQPTWNYFGHLQGYSQSSEADPDADPVADAQTIIRTLCGDGSGTWKE
jgi:hypothetical protein